MALANHRIRTFKNVIEMQQFINTAAVEAVLTGAVQTFGFTFGGVGETLIVEGSNDGGNSFSEFQRTFTVGAVGPHASIAALVAELNTAARWDGAVLPTEFVISNSGDQLTITHAEKGSDYALRISPQSSAIGAVPNADLLLVADSIARGVFGSDGLLTVEHILTDDNGTHVLVYTV